MCHVPFAGQLARWCRPLLAVRLVLAGSRPTHLCGATPLQAGYFAFGGSTIVVLFQAGAVSWDEDILQNRRASGICKAALLAAAGCSPQGVTCMLPKRKAVAIHQLQPRTAMQPNHCLLVWVAASSCLQFEQPGDAGADGRAAGKPGQRGSGAGQQQQQWDCWSVIDGI